MPFRSPENCLLQGTDEKNKKEILFNQFSINYDTLPQILRNGSCLTWASSPTGRTVVVTHEDLTGESFWTKHPDILESTRLRQTQITSTVKMRLYMKKFKHGGKCLPETWIVLCVDGQSFHRYWFGAASYNNNVSLGAAMYTDTHMLFCCQGLRKVENTREASPQTANSPPPPPPPPRLHHKTIEQLTFLFLP